MGVGGTGRSRGKGGYGLNVLYERRINKKGKTFPNVFHFFNEM